MHLPESMLNFVAVSQEVEMKKKTAIGTLRPINLQAGTLATVLQPLLILSPLVLKRLLVTQIAKGSHF